jgi:hypothetical protein
MIPVPAGAQVSSTSTLVAQESAMIELAVPRAAARGESLQMQITTGPLPHGARLALLTESGEVLGAVAPYPPGRPSNTATIPVPRSVIVDGHVRLRLQMLELDAPPRTPRPGEVQRLDLVVVPRTE